MRLEAQGCGMDLWNKVEKLRFNIFLSFDGVLGVLFAESDLFSSNQIGTGTLG